MVSSLHICAHVIMSCISGLLSDNIMRGAFKTPEGLQIPEFVLSTYQ
jgi:hypothetical protein